MLEHSVLDNCLLDLTGASRWWVGYSGGVDSTVLLQLLAAWCERHPGSPPLCAIHVNHHLQDAAAAWQVHCQAQCDSLGVPLTAVDANVQSAGEAGAREARYAVFEERVQATEVLFLAHHLDDQVETFFLRLVRGAGLEGLTAMSPSRPLAGGTGGTVVRPLLGVARTDIEEYARARSLAYIDDPSNADSSIDRNFLRAQVLPQLAQRWPGYRESVNRAIGHLASAATALAERDETAREVYSITGDIGLPLAALRGDAAARVLRRWLQANGQLAPDQAPLEEFLRQLHGAAQDSAPQLQTGAYTLRRFGAAVYLLPRRAAQEPPSAVAITPGERRQIAGVGAVSLLPAAGGGLALEPGESLQLRWRGGGERCRPVGRGGATSVKKLMQEVGVPPWWRDRVPLLYRAEALLAVADIAVCEPGQAGLDGAASSAQFQLIWERENASAD